MDVKIKHTIFRRQMVINKSRDVHKCAVRPCLRGSKRINYNRSIASSGVPLPLKGHGTALTIEKIININVNAEWRLDTGKTHALVSSVLC